MKIIRSIGIIVLLIIGLGALQAQNNSTRTIYYNYDGSGNRVLRTIVVTENKTPKPVDKSDTTTVAKEIKQLIATDNIKTDGGNANIEAIAETNASLSSVASEVIEGGTVKVFPNPVNEIVNVQFTGAANNEGSSLQIYDGTAKLFLNKETLQQHNEISMQSASKGTYFMVIITKDKKRQYWKLVKE